MTRTKDERDMRLKENIARALAAEQQKRIDDRQIAALDRAAESEKQSNEADKHWEEVQKGGERFVTEGLHGYETWMAGLSQVLAGCNLVHQAIRASDPFGSAVKMVYETFVPIGYLIADRFTAPDFTLPSLASTFQFTEKDTFNWALATQSLRRSDKRPLTEDQIILFKSGISAWFRLHGYTAHPDDPAVFLNAAGEQLTRVDFEKLRDNHPTHNLGDFLSGHFDMTCRPEPLVPASPAARR